MLYSGRMAHRNPANAELRELLTSASTIAVVDLLGAANVVRAQTLQIYQPLLLVAGVYLCLTFLIEALYAIAERRGTPLRRSAG